METPTSAFTGNESKTGAEASKKFKAVSQEGLCDVFRFASGFGFIQF